MGTRCLTTFGQGNEEIVVLYRQFDGYPEGHGAELAQFLAGSTIVNGIRGDEGTIFNGMGCLAASVVAHFKEEVGGFYLYPVGTRNRGEDYLYEVYGEVSQEPHIKCSESYGEKDVLFDGSASQYLVWLDTQAE